MGVNAAHQTMLPGEDPNEFEGLRQSMFGALDRQGALEDQLVERIVCLFWRMRRVQAFEMELFEWVAHSQAQRYDAPAADGRLRNDPDGAPTPDLQDSLTFGRMFEAMLSEDLTGKLGRYETTMQRQLSQTMKDLREQQAPRRNIQEEARNEAAKARAKSRLVDPEDEPAYWAEKDRQRIKRMAPP